MIMGSSKKSKKKGGKLRKIKKDSNTSASIPVSDKKVIPNPDVQADSTTAIRGVFDLLMPEMRKLNPVEFSLPTDYPTYDYQFPGSSRQLYKKTATSKPKPLIMEEADPGTCLKSKLYCYNCRQSCRLKPLIKCDYCTTYYHFDCLNPPLITPPVGIWQCPLHVEPFLEHTTLTSTKLSERVRVWEKTREPVDSVSILTKFFRKAYKPNPLFHHKVEINRSRIAEVPDYVMDIYDKNMYHTPIDDIEEDEEGGKIAQDPEVNVLERDSLRRQFIEKSTEITIPTPHGLTKSEMKVAGLTPLDILAEASLTVEADSDAFEKLSPAIIKALAYSKFREMALAKICNAKPVGPNQAEKTSVAGAVENVVENGFPGSAFTKVRPVLTLVCVNSMKKVILRSTSVSIGTGDSVTLNLTKMGSCQGVSVMHANISYDSLQCRWELVNYSPHGTVVDECFLGCDFTPELREPEKYSELPDMSLKKYLIDRNKTALNLYADTDSALPFWNCPCLKRKIPSLRSWEGPIPLKIKSRIKIGCLILLVADTDYIENGLRVSHAKPNTIERHAKRIKLDNDIISPSEDNKNTEKTGISCSTNSSVTTTEEELRTDFPRVYKQKVGALPTTTELDTVPMTKERIVQTQESQPMEVDTEKSKEYEDKEKLEPIAQLNKSKLKMKRQVVFPARSLSHPYAQPCLIPPPANLLPAKPSPKKLVNYFDVKGGHKKVSEVSEEKAEPEVTGTNDQDGLLIKNPAATVIKEPEAAISKDPEIAAIKKSVAAAIKTPDAVIIKEAETVVIKKPIPAAAKTPEAVLNKTPETVKKPGSPAIKTPEVILTRELQTAAATKTVSKEPECAVAKSPELAMTKKAVLAVVKKSGNMIGKKPVAATSKTPESVVTKSLQGAVATKPGFVIIKKSGTPIVIKTPEAGTTKTPEVAVAKKLGSPVLRKPEVAIVKTPESGIAKTPEAAVARKSGTPILKKPEAAIVKTPEAGIAKTPEIVVAKKLGTPIIRKPEAAIVKTLEAGIAKTPEIAVTKKLGTPIIRKPEATIAKTPEAGIAKTPEIAVAKKLGTPIIRKSDATIVKTPETGVAKTTDAAVTKKPGVVIIKKSGTSIQIKKPDAGVTKTPETTIAKKPAIVKTPEAGISNTPKVAVTRKLGVIVTKKPDAALTKKVETDATKKPEAPLMRKSDAAITKKIVGDTVRKPEAVVLRKPVVALAKKMKSDVTKKPVVVLSKKPVGFVTTKLQPGITKKPDALLSKKPSDAIVRKSETVVTRKTDTLLHNEVEVAAAKEPEAYEDCDSESDDVEIIKTVPAPGATKPIISKKVKSAPKVSAEKPVGSPPSPAESSPKSLAKIATKFGTVFKP